MDLARIQRECCTVYEPVVVTIDCFRDNNVEESDLEMYFTCDCETLGKYETFDLKPGGSDIIVTESNKNEYIKYSTLSCLLFVFLSVI